MHFLLHKQKYVEKEKKRKKQKIQNELFHIYNVSQKTAFFLSSQSNWLNVKWEWKHIHSCMTISKKSTVSVNKWALRSEGELCDTFSRCPYSGFLSWSIQAGATVQTAQDTPCKVTLQCSCPHPLGHYSPLTTTIDFFPDEDLAGI